MEKIFREEEFELIESIYTLADDYYIVLRMRKKYGYGPPCIISKKLMRPLNQVARLLTEMINKKNNQVQQLSLITLKNSPVVKKKLFQLNRKICDKF